MNKVASDVELDRIIIPEDKILARIAEIAENAGKKYTGKHPIFLKIMDGADKFGELLDKQLRYLGFDYEKATITIKSMQGTNTTGLPRITKEYAGPTLTGREIVLIEDIIDTGITIKFMQDYLKQYKPKSVHTIALFAKNERREVSELEFDDIGFAVEGFVVGFGLDYKEQYRELNDLWVMRTLA